MDDIGHLGGDQGTQIWSFVARCRLHEHRIQGSVAKSRPEDALAFALEQAAELLNGCTLELLQIQHAGRIRS